MSRAKVLNVQLISLVQTYPVLYDGLAEATKVEKTLAWQEIASLLKEDVSFLRKRWQSLCIAFKKVLQTNHTNWAYYKYMLWFLPSTRTANNFDELEQFLDTLRPINSVPARNDVKKASFNEILAHIKQEPGIDLLPDDTEDDFGEPDGYAEALPDEEATSEDLEEPNTVSEDSIEDPQNSIGDSLLIEDSTKNDSLVDPILDELIASGKPFQCTSRSQLSSRLIRIVKAFPELYAFPLSRSNSFKRSALFEKIANALGQFCTCPHAHITTHFIRQRWRTLCTHFRKDHFKNIRSGTPFGKWKYSKELMFLRPSLNREEKSKSIPPVEPKSTVEVNTAAVETMENDDYDSVDSFFASMAERAKLLSREQQFQLRIRCQEAFSEIEASDKPTQAVDLAALPPGPCFSVLTLRES